ncbi:hypothetical protein A2867_01555 [Candidatus Daviesbacteria bacterium RIFCSPHIGHO2_01_FULL_40_11]|uniref:Uncharacterized protein n=1 Tax=Candidatus Daviesbacteria bacterium RIFCSPHIGHO2_01_FULL_40_11 TaxID=1797762 RepID=A0A1F5JHE5_9BACT|nr:MAG: hypothetical protein A2867_01555 [Candidatus Daviesbacteria bacterium RIFCSPHIGHO2_01_FULL_40_11]OGE62626.1 MAG: hypothetical protein A2964_02550 [Candidatus Daviesbacteria bacterium RIFCSPLOWO2_01_FULL_40_27]
MEDINEKEILFNVERILSGESESKPQQLRLNAATVKYLDEILAAEQALMQKLDKTAKPLRFLRSLFKFQDAPHPDSMTSVIRDKLKPVLEEIRDVDAGPDSKPAVSTPTILVELTDRQFGYLNDKLSRSIADTRQVGSVDVMDKGAMGEEVMDENQQAALSNMLLRYVQQDMSAFRDLNLALHHAGVPVHLDAAKMFNLE